MTTPKSGKGRWLDLGARTAEALEEHFAETLHRSYIHAAQVLFPGTADRSEDRIFAELEGERRKDAMNMNEEKARLAAETPNRKGPLLRPFPLLPGLDSNQ
jgi:hypothetical protein